MGLTKPRAYQIYDIDYKQSVRVVTVSNVTLSGGAPSQVDGVTLSLNDRVLVTGQSTGSQNGLYYVTTVGSGSNGTWARSQDGNQTGEIDAGMIIMVTEGTAYADTQWKLTTNDPIVIGSTALTFVQNYSTSSISAGTSNVVVNANANVTVSSAGTANVLVVTSTGSNVTGYLTASGNITGGNLSGTSIVGTLTTASQTNITSVGTLGSLAVTGNITSGNVSGTRGVFTNLVGTLETAAQTNITSVGTLGSLTVTANVAGGNLTTAGQVTASGNVSGGNINSVGGTFTGNVAFGNIFVGGYYYANGTAFSGGGGGGTPGGSNTYVQFNDNGVFNGTAGLTFNKTTNAVATSGTFTATGNITGGNLSGTSIVGTLTTAAQTNITSVGTLSSLTVTANVTGGNLKTSGVTISSTGVSSTTVTATGNVSGGNIITAGQLVSSIATGTAPMVVTSTTKVSNLNVELVDDFHAAQAGTVSTIVVRDASGYANVAGLLNSGANGVGNIGATGRYFNTAFVKATSAQYADLAEMYVADYDYAPGTVVEFGGEFEITQTTQACSTSVAGIISTNPSYLMNSAQPGEHVLPVALTGRVPCQVQGPVKKGDVLVSSNTPGVAQRIGVDWQPGCTVGKAMEHIVNHEIKTIEVAVGRL